MIRIVVDSAADCVQQREIYDDLVPLSVSIGGKDYLDGMDLMPDRFYDLLVSTKEFPKTSQPSPEVFVEVFRKAKEAGDQVLCFTVSSALSGTYQSAVIAKNMVDWESIYIIDSRTVTHPISVLARYARKRIGEGVPAEQIARECEALKPRIRVVAGLDTLEYLQKGGRLGKTSAVVGQIAGIKPIVTVSEEGTVNAGSKAIGVPRAIAAIVAKLQSVELDESFPIYSLYTCGLENTKKLEQKLTCAGYTTAGRLQVGPTIGSHVGPNVYGVVFVVK